MRTGGIAAYGVYGVYGALLVGFLLNICHFSAADPHHSLVSVRLNSQNSVKIGKSYDFFLPPFLNYLNRR